MWPQWIGWGYYIFLVQLLFSLQNLEAPTLQNMCFTVRPEQLLAVIGPVGAGKVRSVLDSVSPYFSDCLILFHISKNKDGLFIFFHHHFWLCQSSLLSAILGELCHESGVIKVKGELTYMSQQPWILPGTIRSNILFGKELDPKKYDRVLRACALKRVRTPLHFSRFLGFALASFTFKTLFRT